MLAIQNVSKHFGGLKALENVTIHLGPNKIYGLIGPNGAGKTTLFNLITGMLPVSKGSIQFEGKELNKLRPHEISRLGISRTYQNIRLFPSMTALENVLVAQNVHTQAGVRSIFEVRPSAPELLGQAEELLKQMGLWERRKEISTSLAYGEQRRLEIARALALKPKLLLLDEPAAGMNESETENLLHGIEEIRSQGKTILLIEHDMSVIMSTCSHISVLNFGELIAQGTPEEIQANEAVIEAYLGREEG
ncbi:MAG: ABC-type branched-chain amino acid transport system, ATPase component [Deltaproteobacteria bacterium]|nr:ABC-type branched-chain amino acid transport system, ATPase component [Deltaproteobacteria bacterium]